MCWITYRTPKLLKAEEDIKVFKIVRNDMRAFYYSAYVYTVGVTHHTFLGEVNETNVLYYSIDRGLHSYSLNCKIELGHFGGFRVINSKELKILDVYPSNTLKLNCIIPKNALYYLNELGECVSNLLKVLSYERI